MKKEKGNCKNCGVETFGSVVTGLCQRCLYQMGGPHVGKKHSQKTKELMRLAHLGRKYKSWSLESKKRLSQERIGRVPWNKGKLNPSMNGENNFNWKGGISKKNELIRQSIEYGLWRISVLKRDNYTCQICGERGGKLEADHVKPFSLFPELRFAIDNGRTLCRDCHLTTETYAGRLKVTAEKIFNPPTRG
jgi:hypothetical protein